MPPVLSHLFIQYGLYGCMLQQLPVASQDLRLILDRVSNEHRIGQFTLISVSERCRYSARRCVHVERENWSIS